MGDGQTATETLAKPSNGPCFTEAFVFQDAGGHRHEIQLHYIEEEFLASCKCVSVEPR